MAEEARDKCFHVRTVDAEMHELVFAPRRSKAIQASEAYGEIEWVDLRATRVPEFDRYAPQGFVPVEALLEHGWYFECCGRNDYGIRCCANLTVDEKPLIVDEKVYCNQDCYNNSTQYKEAKK